MNKDEKLVVNSCGGCLLFLLTLIIFPFFPWIILIWIVVFIVGKIVKKIKRELKDKENKLRLHKEQQKEIEEKERKTAIIKKSKREMLKRGDYHLVVNFMNKYVFENQELFPNEDEFKKLQLVLSSRGYKLTINELEGLLYEALADNCYDEYKKRVKSDKITSLDGLLKNHAKISDGSEVYLLKRIAVEKGFVDSSVDMDRIFKSFKKDYELKLFENEISSIDNNVGCTMEDLDKMSGFDFEIFLRELFEKNGYKVVHTKLSNDQGADLVIQDTDGIISVQAKRYRNKVPNKAIQEVVASIKHVNADRGMVVTTSYFTRSAVELANSNKVELVDRDVLKKWVKNGEM